VKFISYVHHSSFIASCEGELGLLVFDIVSKQFSWVVGHFLIAIVYVFGYNAIREGAY